MARINMKPESKWIIPLFVMMCFLTYPIPAEESMPLFHYFYSEYCLSCPTGSELEAAFYKTAKQYLRIPFGLIMANTAEQHFYDLYKARYDALGVPVPGQMDQVIFFGNKKIEGQANIEQNLPSFLEDLTEEDIYAAMLQNPPVFSGHDLSAGELTPPTVSTVVYFYVSLCESCEKAAAVLKELPEGINLLRYDINSDDGISLIRQYFTAYKVPDRWQRVPILFVGEKYLGGDGITAENLSLLLESKEPARTLRGAGASVLPRVMPALKWMGIILTGLLNGLNLCGISLLLYFIALLAAKGERLFRVGLLYTMGRFTVYLVCGTAGYHIFLAANSTIVPGLRIFIKFSLAAISFIIAGFFLYDYFSAKTGIYEMIKLQPPERFRQFNYKAIRRTLESKARGIWLSILCFFLGTLISVGEFLCTADFSGGYSVCCTSGNNYPRISSLLITALVFPGLIVLVVMWRDRTAFQASEPVRWNKARIKLLGFIFFLLFSVLIIISIS